MGGPEKIKRQHEKGWLTARERIDRLLDPGSFMEMGLFAHSDYPGMEDKTPADSLICGYGLIKGRRVAVIANDFTVLASTNSKVNLKKLVTFKKQVKEKTKVPVCDFQAGAIEAMFHAAGNKNVRIIETECVAMGGRACIFENKKD